ncbi:hypothetical protein FQR65_LT15410 [Abscondita terminalis]|nr:hypothetical protein FQR65_LT15410 [Abscondita terminalis]
MGSSKSNCLFDEPNRDIITSQFIERLPGERFMVDRQCELEFGLGYRLCPYLDMSYCGSLWCTTDDMEGCKTQHMPWADGTKCGDYSWCHQGKCIPYNRNLLDPIPGGWGDWMPWGPCSRSCGGGVKLSKRNCDSPPPTNGGAYCKGKNVRYASCNHLPCDSNKPDFREMQCSEFDGLTKGIVGLTSDVKWVPKYGMEHPDDFCKLFCRVWHSSSYYLLKEKVIDGTKCGLNTFDICVNGNCRHAGCDNRLDSTTTLDECGVCGGDNSKCEEITGSYNISSYGYNRVVRIPRGSSNVFISQKGYANTSADDNYLALVDGDTGSYVLNGNFVVSQFVKDVIYAGMTISYSGSEKVIEFIKTPPNRKLTKDLVLEVLSVGRLLPPDINYRYMIKNDRAPKYSWRVYEQQWTKCSSMCSGKKYLRPICIELATSQRVHETYCSDLDMNNLVQQKDCNAHCQFVWNLISRGQCSSQCGKGLRPVFYNCVKVDTYQKQRHQQAVNNKHCAILAKPPEAEPCEGSCLSNHWMFDDWSECSKSCGGGYQKRNAVCMDDHNNVIDSSMCSQQENISEQICNAHKCPSWTFDEWSSCSVTCGKGAKTRRAYCNVDGHIYNASSCNLDELPTQRVTFTENNHVVVLEENCSRKPCVFWWTDSWGECNVTCGEGVQKRDIFCRVEDSNTVNDQYCKDLLKPNGSRMCHKPKCEEYSPYNREEEMEYVFENTLHTNSEYKWITAAWSKCTKSCGNGTKSRMVVCRNKFGVENVLKCDQKEVPINVVACNVHPCPMWNFGAWGACDSECWQHRQVSCQNHTGNVVDDDQCDLKMKPHKSTTCNSAHCIRAVTNDRRNYYSVDTQLEKSFKWKFDKWGRCSKSCGKGVKSRVVRCIDTVNAVTVVDQFCYRLKKPKTTRDCEKNNCDYVWVEGLWSQCSQSCGTGYKYRNVTCHRVLKGGLVDPTPLPDFFSYNASYEYCELHSKPSTRTKCLERNCDDKFSWSVGPWNECSHPCGKKGRQTRQLYCVSRDGKKMKPGACPKELRPRRKRKCNKQMCIYNNCKEIKHHQQTSSNRDYYLIVNNKPVLVYCYKMDTPAPEEFVSLKFEQRNFAEMYDKSLNDRGSCPNRGARQDDCDCMPLGPSRSGYTLFWKVRLNITSLQIIPDDFTFSRQIYGKKIPYGTAGDCYSERKGCVQGRFSIDFSDTSFRLSNSVRWIENGNLASSYIDRQDVMVKGRCGGYCASCLPDPNIGLAVEIT